MLVLSRKPGQSIKLGDDMTLTVIAVHGNRVQFGITAPPDVAIHREEVLHRLQAAEFGSSRRESE